LRGPIEVFYEVQGEARTQASGLWRTTAKAIEELEARPR
jgi:hypothetical protein